MELTYSIGNFRAAAIGGDTVDEMFDHIVGVRSSIDAHTVSGRPDCGSGYRLGKPQRIGSSEKKRWQADQPKLAILNESGHFAI